MKHGIKIGKPALLLAPMEGVTDFPMRALLTERGGFSLCVSEFIRVSDSVLPRHVLVRDVPELNSNSHTAAGIPVQVQLLGGNAERLAASALQAIRLGAWGIDLNFGCPAPTVNRHDGGATLLKYPDRLGEIVRAVRAAVPAEFPVSAKIRLGWDCVDDVYENARQAAEAGASWLTIHGRTREQGYAPPALWEPIGQVREELSIPVVANGDIWTIEDFKRCQAVTGCEHFMIGRGALANPPLPRQIAMALGVTTEKDDYPVDWALLLRQYGRHVSRFQSGDSYLLRRMKQWLNMAHRAGHLPWFSEVKRAQTVAEMLATIERVH